MVAIYQIANNLKTGKHKKMDSPAFFSTVFIACLLLSITGYSIYVGFGPPSQDLRDPFQEHED
jgi:PsbN protein